MERIKQMGLKKAFFCLTLFYLCIALILGGIAFAGCIAMRRQEGDNIVAQMKEGTVDVKVTENYSTEQPAFQIWDFLQIFLPVFFVIAALIIADVTFYRVKLKNPIGRLQDGARRIMHNDLDFQVQQTSGDELGQLCGAFESMRRELQKNNREMWRQMEERKRLNAAFAHDLRNPVTVLKGCAKLMRKGMEQQNTDLKHLDSTVGLMEEYSQRIEIYVEAMSKAQRLEEVACKPEQTDLGQFTQMLEKGLKMLVPNIRFQYNNPDNKNMDSRKQTVWLDTSLIQEVLENLVSNARRYARQEITVQIAKEDSCLVISVRDDGGGFPKKILEKGGKPFLRGEENSEEHFGMGLYISRLLCEKHGGQLKIQNLKGNSEDQPTGALVETKFQTSWKP
ncbi:sensor histidine kinase [Robinsoniella peoriensis]|nr:HAMP domain-containing sensor histidine kinase [Robinsoniella peoriensis]MDU7030225.1 HAMP domain-containing sensor histidine kinase [Clostridiales bacterium]